MTVRTADGVSRSEARLEARAIRRGWPIPEDLKQKIVDRTVALLDAGPRYEAIAIGALNTMERTNIEAERLELDRAKFERGAEQAPAQVIINCHEPPQPEPLPDPEGV